MKKISLFLFAVVLTSTSAFANVSIECGRSVDQTTGIVSQKEFQISSEHGNLNGPAGRGWQLYDGKGKKTAGTLTAAGNALELKMTIGQSVSGPVGSRYVIEDFRGQNFVSAKKFTMGGFAGSVQTGTLSCAVSED